MKENKINLFSDKFDMCYVLKKLNYNKNLLCDKNYNILNREKQKCKINKLHEQLIEKQQSIILQTKEKYIKLNSMSYLKYHLPHCIQPKTKNTNLSLSNNIYQQNIKKNILKELELRKKTTEYTINYFIEKYTGKFKSNNILHKKLSNLYKSNSQIEILIKNRKKYFDKIIGNISFFDNKINILLENVTLKTNFGEKQIPWMFINGNNIIFIKKYKFL